MRVNTIIGLVPSVRIRTPALFGFVRPRLLRPAKIIGESSREDLRYIFLHELAHLKHRDIALGWLTSLLQVRPGRTSLPPGRTTDDTWPIVSPGPIPGSSGSRTFGRVRSGRSTPACRPSNPSAGLRTDNSLSFRFSGRHITSNCPSSSTRSMR